MKRVFVFGSNEAGIHGAGSAEEAALLWDAKHGVGVGPTGHAYAIPTKNEKLRRLPLPRIKAYVARFLRWAEAHPDTKFITVAIGCGLAGYTPEDIAPFFAGAPDNVELPDVFKKVLYGNARSRRSR